jgi:hypothetical protein
MSLSLFTNLVIILGMLAGVINFAIGIMRHDRLAVAMLRFGAGIVAFAIAIILLIANVQDIALLPKDLETWNPIFLFIALGIFIGATLMLPTTLQSSMLPPEEKEIDERATGKLAGKVNGESSGIRFANQSEDWVN